MIDIRYPIGKCTIDPDITPAKRATWISDIANLPANLRQAIAGLSDEQLTHAIGPPDGRYGKSSTTWQTNT